MNEIEPLKSLLKNVEVPHLPQQGINNFLNEALKGVQATARLADLSGDLAKRVASMRILSDINRETVRSIQPLQSSVQAIIHAAHRVSLKHEFDHIKEQTNAISKLAKIYSSPVFGGISQVIHEAMAANQVWQSSRITDFASRILEDYHFRQTFIQRLASEPLPETQAQTGDFSTDQILEAVEQGIEESGILQQRDSVEAVVAAMFSWWGKLPSDLRSVVIGLIVTILGLVIEYGVLVKDQPTSQVPVNQRVRIVKRITNNIFVNVGISSEVRRQFRIVMKDELPAFRSMRRNSGKIGTLTAGQIVTVKSQRRNWTQVEWKDADSQEMLTGWVFTRYLQRFGQSN